MVGQQDSQGALRLGDKLLLARELDLRSQWNPLAFLLFPGYELVAKIGLCVDSLPLTGIPLRGIAGKVRAVIPAVLFALLNGDGLTIVSDESGLQNSALDAQIYLPAARGPVAKRREIPKDHENWSVLGAEPFSFLVVPLHILGGDVIVE